MSNFQTTPSLAYVDLKLSSLDNCSPDKQIEVRALLIDYYDPDDSKNIHSSVELKNKIKTFIDLDMDTSVDSTINSDSSNEQSQENVNRTNSDFSASHSSNLSNKHPNKSTTQTDRKIETNIQINSPSHLLDSDDDIEMNSTIYISCFYLKDSKEDLNNGQTKTDLISFDN
jgi:hypothetical protein